jgi:4-amino-4-deoxy-L-arabinose transferase-like glycosyltransferase
MAGATMTTPGTDVQSGRARALPIILPLLLALATRLFRLTGQSMWYDEGNSVALAQRSLATIINSAAADIHPPLYYIALSFWVNLFGTGEIAVRLLSVVCGVALVYVTYLLGRRLFGATAGLAAAFLAALSPFQVYYSQEARMYMPATLLGALSTYLLITALFDGQRNRLVRWLAYILVTTAALYTHYFAATVVIAQNVAIAVWLIVMLARRASNGRELVQRVAPLVAAQVIVALCYLPWLPAMATQFNNWPAISEFFGLPTLLNKIFFIFGMGFSVDPQAMWQNGLVTAAALVFALLLALGITYPLRRTQEKDTPATLLVTAWLLVPILTMFVLSLRRPMYNPKFLLVATPAFYLLLGYGVQVIGDMLGSRTALRRIVTVALLGILTVSSLSALRSYYGDPRFARDDYRAVAQTIQTGARDSDAVVLNAPGQIDIFGYYYKGALPLYPLPHERPLDEKATLAELADIAAGHSRIWVVYYGDQQADPTRVIASWLEQTAFKASDRWFGNVRLVLYAMPQASVGGMQPVNATFGASIRLLGYRLEAAAATAGDIVPLTLFWQAGSAVGERYVVFAHIINTHNALWGQRDSEPGGGLQPTTTWRVGETVQDNYGIPILAGTPPGSYQIEIGLYRPDTGQRLQVTDSSGATAGDRVLIGPLVVARPAAPPTSAALGMQHSATSVFSGLRLLGYSLARLGQDPGATEFGGDDILHLSLFWQAPAQPLPDLTVAVQVLDSRGKAVRQTESRPADGDYPTNTWSAGEVVRDQHRLALAGLAAGQYRITIEVANTNGGKLGQAQIGEIRVK